MIKKILKILFLPLTMSAGILVGSILGALSMIVYVYYWTFNENKLWQIDLQKK